MTNLEFNIRGMRISGSDVIVGHLYLVKTEKGSLEIAEYCMKDESVRLHTFFKDDNAQEIKEPIVEVYTPIWIKGG
jgi:hypothetical protein